MIKITVLLVVSLLLAHQSQQYTDAITRRNLRYSLREDPWFLLLTILLCLFAGLRTDYNDTANYIREYSLAPGLAEFLSQPENWNPLKNPLFHCFQGLLIDLGADAQMLIFTASLFSQVCFLRFLKCYSRHFTFSIFLYFTLGTFCLTLAALKQVLAMAILTLAFPYLEKRNWPMYVLWVIIAMLVHTYAISFLVIPLFTRRPWGWITWLLALVTIIFLLNFQAAIQKLLAQADAWGKPIPGYEVFDSVSVNVLRLAVYSVPPLISLLFRKWIFRNSTPMDHVLVHMSILSFACLSLGTRSGANMFGRMAGYFELGTVCILPEMLEKTFDKRSFRLISGIAVVCFLGYFLYANGIHSQFDTLYRATDILDLLIP